MDLRCEPGRRDTTVEVHCCMIVTSPRGSPLRWFSSMSFAPDGFDLNFVSYLAIEPCYLPTPKSCSLWRLGQCAACRSQLHLSRGAASMVREHRLGPAASRSPTFPAHPAVISCVSSTGNALHRFKASTNTSVELHQSIYSTPTSSVAIDTWARGPLPASVR
jgi:hypothetical protein